MADEYFMSALSSALDTIQRASALLDRTASRIAIPLSVDSAGTATGDTVDLSAEMLDLVQARNTSAIGVKLAQAVDETQKAALNVLG